MNQYTYPKFNRVVLSVCMLALAGTLSAAEESSTKTAPAATASNLSESAEVVALKAQLAEQQKQLEALRSAMENQQRMLNGLLGAAQASVPSNAKTLGEVASLSPMVPPSPVAPTAAPIFNNASLQKNDTPAPSPLSLKIGETYFTPVGFMDFTSVWRSTVGGGGIGSNFGSIPFARTATLPVLNGHLSEQRFSMQNSRLGGRFDTKYKGVNVLGYFETDFLGNNPANVAVSSNSNTLRSRVYFVDLSKDHWEFLAGQTWSLITPGRTGISPLPGNLFYSQNIDVNYQAGLVWGRIPEVRFVYHSSDKKIHFAIAADQQEQYVGGSGGAGIVASPSALSGTEFTSFNNAGTTVGAPNVAPDLIAKIAFDPSPRLHAEFVGLETNFKGFNPATNQHYTKTGGGGAFNFNAQIFKGFRVLTNIFFSDGGGRYIFGEAPSVVLKGDGSLGLIHSNSNVSGAEYTHKNTLLYGYYSAINIGQYTVVDPNGGKPQLVGYGYTGSANNHNKTIQEATFGFNQTLWKDAKFGALNFMGQYSYLSRNPWYVATGTPSEATQSQLYFNIRYTLPGSAPAIK